MKRVFAVFAACILAFLFTSASAQTLTLNDGTIVQGSTNRMGLNIGAIDYWDSGQILKNLIGSTNPGFEALQNRQIWALTAAGSATTFTIPDQYDGVPPNYWAGGTFTVVESQSGGAELGCTGAIASNTGPNYPVAGVTTWVAPVVTVSTACGASFSVGDVVVMSRSTFPTPESWWESGALGGMAGTVTGGAQLLSDTTDLCATCGAQSLNMNAATAGSSATAAWYFDSENTDNIFVLMNGAYQLTFWAKAASGTPVLTASASRGSKGGFNCGLYKPALTPSWAQYTWNCTASESAASTSPGTAQVAINVTGGSVYLDNVSFEKGGTNPSNTTVLRDEVIAALQSYYGLSIGSNPGMFRYWVNQNGETISNWTQPDYAHAPSSGGTGYFVGPGGAGVVSLSLEDYLAICQLLNAEPYLEVPVTLSTTDAANLIEFLASPSSTAYGSRRAALGQANPWTSEFSKIHLSFCNECWNGQSFSGQSLAMRSTAPNSEYYYDYSVRTRDIFAAMRADSYYSAPSFDLVMNAQTGVNYSMDTAIQRARPDSIEIEGYTYGSVSSFGTDSALWQPAMVEPYEKVTNPTDVYNFYQSVHDYQSQTTCGGTGTAACKVNVYEWGQGTIAGSLDQTHLDYVNAGAGEGVVMALQPLLNMQYYGIRPQSFFSLTEFKNGGPNGLTSKLWGNVVDMGGATNNVRPEFLGVQLANQSIIGPMYSCPIAGNLTYNFAGSPNGIAPLPALNNVPYLYAFCFENGTKRSLVLINTDLSSSHTIGFAGTNPPQGTVTQRQFAPAELDDMNEAPTGTATNLTPDTVAIEMSTLSSPGSITLPPFSATALDYSASGSTAAAAPIFSPAAGSYTIPQSVTINDATSGTTIYYTTNGTTPTTSSSVYSGAITVNSAETLEAIAVETGYTNSAVSTAAYTIASALPAPTFSPAGGSYSAPQSVTIGDATAGTTIYYTTNGTAPTTSSSVYSGPVTVSSTETLEAIAVETGYTNSTVATAAYTIAAGLPAPTFSPAPGTYTSPQSVTISDAQAGTTIYYTTNATTPTTSSTQYMGAIWQSSTQTLKAIAVETGYANSAVTTAAYMIAPVLPAPTFSPTGGGASWATFTTPPSVTISETQAGTTIYYTTNGTTPTTSSRLYTGPITVSLTETIEAIAVETGYTNSPMSSMLYTIAPILPTPTFSLAGGNYTTSQSVTVSDATAGTTIYYTTNGTAPTTSSTKYTGAITVSSTETLDAIAVASGSCNSAVATAAYTINTALPAPTFSPAAGTYTTSQTVTISDATAGTTIYYTNNGTTPTTSSNVYSGPITVSSTETLEAIAVETGYTNSPVTTAAYTIAPMLPAPAFSLAPGTYTTSQTVTMSDATAGTTIYYTNNGTTPTTSSSVYSGPITVSTTGTLEAIAVETGYTNSTVASAAYTIAPMLPAPAFSLAPGTYTTSQTVTFSDATAGTTIYYTTNGTTPTTSSSVYSGAITVSATETLEAIAVETGYTNSMVATATYTISASGTSYINYPSSGFTASSLSLNNGTTVSGGVLQVTDGGTGEMRSAWSTTKVPVSSFTTDFTFQMLAATADGITFTIQNDPKGIYALGSGGSGLGYQGIQNSVALKFDIYNDAGEGADSVGVYTDGAAPTVPATDLSSTGIMLSNGDLMHVHIVYSGMEFTGTLTDTKTGASVTKQLEINITSIVGSNTAYVGFTGSTGSMTAVQNVTSWSYTAP
jgi:hypothetical protein